MLPAPYSRETVKTRILSQSYQMAILIALDSDAAPNAAWARRVGMISYLPRSVRVAFVARGLPGSNRTSPGGTVCGLRSGSVSAGATGTAKQPEQRGQQRSEHQPEQRWGRQQLGAAAARTTNQRRQPERWQERQHTARRPKPQCCVWAAAATRACQPLHPEHRPVHSPECI